MYFLTTVSILYIAFLKKICLSNSNVISIFIYSFSIFRCNFYFRYMMDFLFLNTKIFFFIFLDTLTHFLFQDTLTHFLFSDTSSSRRGHYSSWMWGRRIRGTTGARPRGENSTSSQTRWTACPGSAAMQPLSGSLQVGQGQKNEVEVKRMKAVYLFFVYWNSGSSLKTVN